MGAVLAIAFIVALVLAAAWCARGEPNGPGERCGNTGGGPGN